MQKTAIVAVIFSLSVPRSAYADPVTIERDTFSCDKATIEQIEHIGIERDKAGFVAALQRGYERGNCHDLKKGTKVYVEETLLRTTRIRLAGAPDDVWIFNMDVPKQ